MAEKIDMSLDEIIKRDRISVGRKRGQRRQPGRGANTSVGRGGGAGPVRNQRQRNRAMPYNRVCLIFHFHYNSLLINLFVYL
jgi:hypothetical protein